MDRLQELGEVMERLNYQLACAMEEWTLAATFCRQLDDSSEPAQVYELCCARIFAIVERATNDLKELNEKHDAGC